MVQSGSRKIRRERNPPNGGKCGKGNGSLFRRLTACFLRRHYPDRFYGFRWRGLSCLREQAALRQEVFSLHKIDCFGKVRHLGRLGKWRWVGKFVLSATSQSRIRSHSFLRNFIGFVVGLDGESNLCFLWEICFIVLKLSFQTAFGSIYLTSASRLKSQQNGQTFPKCWV